MKPILTTVPRDWRPAWFTMRLGFDRMYFDNPWLRDEPKAKPSKRDIMKRLPGWLHDELERQWDYLNPPRREPDPFLFGCLWKSIIGHRDPAPLSINGIYHLCPDCELKIGVGLDYWLRCPECLCPFVCPGLFETPRVWESQRYVGFWVLASARDRSICQCCEVIRACNGDIGQACQLALARSKPYEGLRAQAVVELSRGRSDAEIFKAVADSIWCDLVLYELLRLKRANVEQAIMAVDLRARKVLADLRADERAIDAFARRDGWSGRARYQAAAA